MRFLLVLCILACVLSLSAAEKAKAEAKPVDIPSLVASGDKLLAQITKKIDGLLKDSPHPLFTEHLRSLRSLLVIEWATITLDAQEDLKAAQAFVKYADVIQTGLEGDASEWKTYAEGRRPLIRGFVADHDRAFSYYTIQLPANWDANKTYPSVFYLHGYTPQPYMIWMINYGFRGTEAPARNLDYFQIGVWGRGNTSYRYAGEVDLDHVVADFQETFTYNEKRMYLCGHSMGSFGSWGYAVDRPDVWAALGLYAGADALAPVGTGFAQNVAHLPIHIWHGEKDYTVVVENVDRFKAALSEFGNTPSVTLDPEGGHMVSKKDKGPNRQWLLQHEQTRPNPMRFKVAHARYPGAWGITLRVDPGLSPNPSYACRIDGQSVWITTSGTTGMQVNLGPMTADELAQEQKHIEELKKKNRVIKKPLYKRLDLGMRGDVKVYWNGKLVYEGPAKQINLGDGIKSVWHQMRDEKRAALKAEQEAQEKLKQDNGSESDSK